MPLTSLSLRFHIWLEKVNAISTSLRAERKLDAVKGNNLQTVKC